jgi:hypothetical protein
MRRELPPEKEQREDIVADWVIRGMGVLVLVLAAILIVHLVWG